MHINKHIFREYDIRGLADIDLSPEFAAGLGKAFVEMLKKQGAPLKVLVGHDNRQSSPDYSHALLNGLAASGAETVSLGEVPTPVFYHAGHRQKFPAGIMVTASHNPPEYNGFKIVAENRSIHGIKIQELRKAMEALPEVEKGELADGEAAGYPGATSEYLDAVKKRIRLEREVRVVLDCGNGTAGPVALPALQSIGAEVISLYCDSDNSFPNHPPDPVVPENMADLAARVRETGAEVGIGIDGDGDRVGLCDEEGNLIWGDTILALLSREILGKHPGAPIIFDVKCSQGLSEEIARLGGRPEMWKTGHSLIEARMRELKAVAAGELSGHIYLADEWFGFDDAIYTAARFLRFFSRQNESLSRLVASLPRYYATPEIRMEAADAEKFALVDRLSKKLAAEGYNCVTIDGVKVLLEDGWGLVRASNTQPALVMRFEGRSPERRDEIRKWMVNALEELRG